MKNWFIEFDRHLIRDERPSEYFSKITSNDNFPTVYPFNMLIDLIDVQQSPVHHPEGDAWVHTMLVVDNAAKVKHKSSDARAFMWAALLHDLGKVPSTKIRNGRITAYDHDVTGEILARDFLRACGQLEKFVEKVSALVRWHMQPFFVVRNMPFRDIDAMARQTDLEEIALLSYCDRLGRGDLSEKKVSMEEQNMARFLEKCREHTARAYN